MTSLNTNMHFHRYDRMGQILAKGGLSLAIQQDGSEVTIALAQCSREDNFNRKLGRAVAQGRLRKAIESAPKTIVHKNIVRATIPEAVALKSFVIELPEVKALRAKLLAGGK
jgi:hypothetical protein